MGVHIYKLLNIEEKFKIPEINFLSFMVDLADHYKPKDEVLYHNAGHGCDTMCTQYYLIKKSDYFKTYTDLDIFASLIAAAAHDVGHDGFTNGFHIRTYSDLAVLYNDRSVLENHHASLGWRLLEKHQVLNSLSKDDRSRFRNVFTKCIL